MEQLNKNKHTYFRDRRTAAEQRTPEVTCYWAEHTVWDRADFADPSYPEPSQRPDPRQPGPAVHSTCSPYPSSHPER